MRLREVLTMFPFPQDSGAPEALQYRLGGALQYELEVYCREVVVGFLTFF